MAMLISSSVRPATFEAARRSDTGWAANASCSNENIGAHSGAHWSKQIFAPSQSAFPKWRAYNFSLVLNPSNAAEASNPTTPVCARKRWQQTYVKSNIIVMTPQTLVEREDPTTLAHRRRETHTKKNTRARRCTTGTEPFVGMSCNYLIGSGKLKYLDPNLRTSKGTVWTDISGPGTFPSHGGQIITTFLPV